MFIVSTRNKYSERGEMQNAFRPFRNFLEDNGSINIRPRRGGRLRITGPVAP
jgi:hypothetical protein